LRAALPRSLKSAFTHNLPYKAVAIFLSMVLWFVVEQQSPRVVEERVSVQLVFLMDSSLVRVSPLPEVRAQILVPMEPPGEALRLETNPPQIRRVFHSDDPDTVVVRLRARDVILHEGSKSRVTDVFPNEFVVRFDSLMQKTVPVRSLLRVTAGDGIAIGGAPRFDPDSVTIVGRRQTVASIFSVSTEGGEIVVRDSSAVMVRLVSPAPGIEVIPAEIRMRVPVIRMQLP
jgi:hypothetical protein